MTNGVTPFVTRFIWPSCIATSAALALTLSGGTFLWAIELGGRHTAAERCRAFSSGASCAVVFVVWSRAEVNFWWVVHLQVLQLTFFGLSNHWQPFILTNNHVHSINMYEQPLRAMPRVLLKAIHKHQCLLILWTNGCRVVDLTSPGDWWLWFSWWCSSEPCHR